MDAKIKILQLSREKDKEREFLFMDWEYVEKKGGINLSLYDTVYEMDFSSKSDDVNGFLEDVFRKFNVSRPSDFKGHSLSVSDVIYVEGKGYYFCDSFGFVKCKDENKKKEMKLKIKVFQIDPDRDKKRVSYARWSVLQKVGGLDFSIYDEVYSGEFSCEADSIMDFLENVFEEFNVGKRPEDYNGHSLSVSDIVYVDGHGYFYCDSRGFLKIDKRDILSEAAKQLQEIRNDIVAITEKLNSLRKAEKTITNL